MNSIFPDPICNLIELYASLTRAELCDLIFRTSHYLVSENETASLRVQFETNGEKRVLMFCTLFDFDEIALRWENKSLKKPKIYSLDSHPDSAIRYHFEIDLNENRIKAQFSHLKEEVIFNLKP